MWQNIVFLEKLLHGYKQSLFWWEKKGRSGTGGRYPFGQSSQTVSKNQLMLCRSTEVIISIRLWVSSPSHPHAALLPCFIIRVQIASLGHAAGILWMAKQIRPICSSYLWGRLQYTSVPVSQHNVIKIPPTVEIHEFQGRGLLTLHIRAVYKDFKCWLSRPEGNIFLLIFHYSSLNI